MVYTSVAAEKPGCRVWEMIKYKKDEAIVSRLIVERWSSDATVVFSELKWQQSLR